MIITDEMMMILAYDETFRPTHAMDFAGFKSFLSDISNLLEIFGMEVKLGREDIGKGRGWVVLVRICPCTFQHH